MTKKEMQAEKEKIDIDRAAERKRKGREWCLIKTKFENPKTKVETKKKFKISTWHIKSWINKILPEKKQERWELSFWIIQQ